MAEYIEREALLRDIGDNPSPIYEAFRIAVKRQPAADVADVRRGKWVRKENTQVYWYACSLCGKKVSKNEYGDDYFSDYCPNCGAAMFDGKE